MKNDERPDRDVDSAAALAHAIDECGWSIEAEVATLVALARCDDPMVSLSALKAICRTVAAA